MLKITLLNGRTIDPSAAAFTYWRRSGALPATTNQRRLSLMHALRSVNAHR